MFRWRFIGAFFMSVIQGVDMKINAVEIQVANNAEKQGEDEAEERRVYRIEEDAFDDLTHGRDYNEFFTVDTLVEWMCDEPSFNLAVIKAAAGNGADLWAIMDKTLNGERDKRGKVIKDGLFKTFRNELLKDSDRFEDAA